MTEHVTKGSTISRDLRVNQMIRIPQVRVVDEEGAQLGVMPTPEALAMAQERGLDLVEVAPMAAPPVVKFLDFGQYKYELTKREKEAKRKQRSVTFKEVRLKPKIGTGDFDTKVRRAIQFLEEGDRIKVAVQFRGRELTHPEIGRALLARFSDQIKDHGVVERAPLLEGKSMHITVASVHKPKVVEHPTKHGHAAEEPAENGAHAPATPDRRQPGPRPQPRLRPQRPRLRLRWRLRLPWRRPRLRPRLRRRQQPRRQRPRPSLRRRSRRQSPRRSRRPRSSAAPTAEPKAAPKTTRTTTRARKTTEPEAPAPAPAGE